MAAAWVLALASTQAWRLSPTVATTQRRDCAGVSGTTRPAVSCGCGLSRCSPHCGKTPTQPPHVGEEIAFTPTGATERTVEPLISSPFGTLRPAIAPDGRELFYRSGDAMMRVWPKLGTRFAFEPLLCKRRQNLCFEARTSGAVPSEKAATLRPVPTPRDPLR